MCGQSDRTPHTSAHQIAREYPTSCLIKVPLVFCAVLAALLAPYNEQKGASNGIS